MTKIGIEGFGDRIRDLEAIEPRETTTVTGRKIKVLTEPTKAMDLIGDNLQDVGRGFVLCEEYQPGLDTWILTVIHQSRIV